MRSLVKIAVAGALLASGATAYADVAQPDSGNGELVLFVRDGSNESRVYARGLGITMDQLLTQAQITGDPTKPNPQDASNNFADTDTLTFSLGSAIGPDANLTQFLSSGSNFQWTIMGGDNQGGQTGEGNRRYVTTTQFDFTTTPSTLTNGIIGQGAYNGLNGMLAQLNGTLAGGVGSMDSTQVDGLWGQSNQAYTAATNWFGAGPVNDNAIGSSAHFYLLTTSAGGNSNFLARVYKGVDFTLSADGTLTSAAGPGVPQVPVPAAVWLLGSALVGLTGIRRRKVEVAA
jgi:hypothetical protein